MTVAVAAGGGEHADGGGTDGVVLAGPTGELLHNRPSTSATGCRKPSGTTESIPRGGFEGATADTY